MSLPNPLADLASVVLQFAIAKYIEKAGTSAEMLARAQTIKAIATEADEVALGSMTVAQLQTATLEQITNAKISVSNQVLVTGLVDEISSVLPAQGTLLGAAISGASDQFLKQVMAVCARFGA